MCIFKDNWRQHYLIPSESAMTFLIEAYTGVESVFALLSPKETKATDNAVMRIVLPEMFPKVTFSVSQIGA